MSRKKLGIITGIIVAIVAVASLDAPWSIKFLLWFCMGMTWYFLAYS